MAEGSKYNGSSGLTKSGVGRATSEFDWTEDDEESLRVLKLGGALGIFMLLAYLAYDQQARGEHAPGTDPHWLILAATCLFFGLSWTHSFKRHWKFWILSVQPGADRDLHPDQPRDGRPRVALHRDHVVSAGNRVVRELGNALAVRDGSDSGAGLRGGRILRADRNRHSECTDGWV